MKKIIYLLVVGMSLQNVYTSTVNDMHVSPLETLKLDQQTKDILSKKLSEYHVTGVAFCVDPNVAFIYDNQNPSFVMTFQNPEGEIKTRAYEASINSLGLKFECAIKLDLIMFVNTDLNFEESTKELQLGTGIELSFSTGIGLSLTYAPFTNAAGGILILGVPLLFSINPISIVIGGTLKPVLP